MQVLILALMALDGYSDWGVIAKNPEDALAFVAVHLLMVAVIVVLFFYMQEDCS